MRRLLMLLLVLLAPAVMADTPVRSFVAGSLAQIQAARQGKPFVLAFWSIGCTHCPTELKTLGDLKRRHPKLDVVLVAADTPDDAPQTALLAKSYGLGKVEQWVFADLMPERLRFEIDRRWYGELPRTHFYDRNHKVEAVSGVVPEERLQRWIREAL
jgi:thiol-disulfide isomerase/thioredoxin